MCVADTVAGDEVTVDYKVFPACLERWERIWSEKIDLKKCDELRIKING